jgi:hypothetical protein
MNIKNEAQKTVKDIWHNYHLLNTDNENFFNQYHDNLRLQADCSTDVFSEIVEYLKLQDVENAKYYLQQLKDTLVYCKAVINLQKKTNDLPQCIFG